MLINMENSKEYNEALERAKKIICNLPEGDQRIADIETIFPELADSNDEKIRKALVKFFKESKKNDETWAGINLNEIIFWLMRQKEVKKDEDKSHLLHKVLRYYINSSEPYDVRNKVSTEIIPYVEALEKKLDEPVAIREDGKIRIYEPETGTYINTAVIEAISQAKKYGRVILKFNDNLLLVEGDSNQDAVLKDYYRKIN